LDLKGRSRDNGRGRRNSRERREEEKEKDEKRRGGESSILSPWSFIKVRSYEANNAENISLCCKLKRMGLPKICSKCPAYSDCLTLQKY